MNKKILSLAFGGALLAASALPSIASAHTAPPCNDTDGDGAPSGRDYAAHHIKPLATAGALGNEGHKPGAHKGFSVCDPSSHAPGQQE